jgi:two-component system sensor histidine kinase/response regulator
MASDKNGQDQQPLILIVDDLPGNLKILAGILKEQGFRIAVADSGAQTLNVVKTRPPDLILLDIMMPEMDGFEVCKRLKKDENAKDIPVIFLTALTEVENMVKGFELGAVDYVTKPFNVNELLSRVNNHLQLRKAQNQVVELEQHNAVLAMAITASHELNQPLTVLAGNFELFRATLTGMTLSDKQINYLTRIQSSILQVQELLQKFSDPGSISFENYVGTTKMARLDP